jgi:hypothetical protein
MCLTVADNFAELPAHNLRKAGVCKFFALPDLGNVARNAHSFFANEFAWTLAPARVVDKERRCRLTWREAASPRGDAANGKMPGTFTCRDLPLFTCLPVLYRKNALFTSTGDGCVEMGGACQWQSRTSSRTSRSRLQRDHREEVKQRETFSDLTWFRHSSLNAGGKQTWLRK